MESKKVALVTGAGMGIGKAIAARLAADGFAVAINDLKADLAEKTAAELGAAVAAPADVSNEDGARAMMEAVIGSCGRIDVLVNNAGIAPVRALDEISSGDFERTMRVNLSSVFICSRLVAPYMIRQGGGKILNAASQSAFQQSPVTIEYCTSKWAIRGLTRSLAMSLAPHGITVNAYCPGKVNTGMQDYIGEKTRAYAGQTAQEYDAAVKGAIPLGKFISPEEVAGLVSYLASKDADNITGQSIMINGGQIMS